MYFRKQVFAPGAFAAAILISSGALAQDETRESAEELGIEEITVTARKREENLRDIPVAVTAMTAQTIAEAGIRDIQDLALMSPGLSYREGFGRATGDANNRPSIRGMSSILGNPNAAFFVDGIYVDGPITAYSLENLERVEVIRGPQAATFGRGTFAGAVNFITRRPNDEFQGQFKIEAGDHRFSEVSGFISGPLIENELAAELNFRHYDIGSDPEYPNLAPNGAEIGAESTASFGVKVSWTPTDAASFYLNLNWSSDSDGAFAYSNWNGGDNDADNINVNSPNTSNCFGPNFTFFSTFFTTDRSRGYWCGEIGTPQAYWQDSGGLKGVDRNTSTANLIADFDIGESTFTSVTGYTNYDYENAFAAVYDGAFASWSGRDDNTVLSQEFRFVSAPDRPVRFVAGAYYYRQRNGDGFSTGFNPQTTSPSDIDLDSASFTDESEIENTAVFAGVDFDIGDALTLSAEARYQEEEQKLSGTNAAGGEQYEGSPAIDFDAFLPRVALTWRASDNLNVYASLAEGNNPGDFNEDYYDTTFVQAERDIFVASRGSYDESEVTAYELGFKGLFMDGRLLLNAALYRNEWEKQALTNSDALTRAATGTQSTVAYITTAGESEVQGLEFELIAKPTDWLDLTLSYALAESEFNDYLDENFRDLQDTNGIYTGLDFTGAPVVDTEDPDGQVAGNELPQTPRHMGSLGARFHWDMANDAETYLRLDYSYESKRYVQAANLAWIGASGKVNARFGYRRDNWDFSVWAKNLTDDDTPEVVTRLLDFRQPFLIPSQVRVSGLRFTFIRDFTVTAPRSRQIGATLTYRF